MIKYDVVLAGVGGQGIVSLGVVLGSAARRQGLQVQLSEVHGMAQRGGSVEAALRLADGPIHGSLVPCGGADMLLATEPLEALRHLAVVKSDGLVLSSSEPFDNIPDYPDIEGLLARLRSLPRALLIPAGEIAARAGTRKAANLVMAGAASVFIGLETEIVEELIQESFGAKGDKIVEANREAFLSGRQEAQKCAPHPVA